MSQVNQIHTHLRRAPLTALAALRLYDCMRLAARIAELRGRGLDIRTRTIQRGRKKFAQYSLAK